MFTLYVYDVYSSIYRKHTTVSISMFEKQRNCRITKYVWIQLKTVEIEQKKCKDLKCFREIVDSGETKGETVSKAT